MIRIPNSIDFEIYNRYWSSVNYNNDDINNDTATKILELMYSVYKIDLNKLNEILYLIHNYKLNKTDYILEKYDLFCKIKGEITEIRFDPPTNTCSFDLHVNGYGEINHDCTIIFNDGFFKLPYSSKIIISVYKQNILLCNVEKIFAQHFFGLEIWKNTMFGL